MDEYASSLLQCIIDEFMAGFEVLSQIGRRSVVLADPLVGVGAWELRIKAGTNGKDMGDASACQNELTLSGDVVSNVDSLDYLVQRLNLLVRIVHLNSK